MAYPHVIRLRGPWECRPLARYSLSPSGTVVEQRDQLAGQVRVTPPVDWSRTLGADFRGRVLYSRRFNRPTNLDADDRVWLVVDGIDAHGRLSLDEQPLGTIDGYPLQAEYDITALLRPSSVLTIEVELPLVETGGAGVPRPGRESLAGGLIGEVRLEIRKEVFVADPCVYWSIDDGPRLHLAGRIEGTAGPEKLAIMAGACEREIAYQEVARGARFELAISIDDWPAWPDPMDEPVLTPVELRLTDGRAALWQTIVETAPPQPDGEKTRAAMLRRLADGTALPWLDWVDEAGPPFREALARPGTVVGLRGILSDRLYQKLTGANVGVVQHVPASWAEQVCARLAHHPCILAWARAVAASSNGSALSSATNTYARPWLRV